MSWLFCYLSNQKSYKNEFTKNNQLLYEYCGKNLYISAGGNKKTCIAGEDNTKKKGFIVCGVGIEQDRPQFITNNNWKNILERNTRLEKIDGHFVIIKWDEKKIEIFTDVLGLRDIYAYHAKNEMILSTNILWLKKYTKLNIDFQVFGSRWLLFNQISSVSIFKNINRITAGHHLIINRENLKCSEDFNDFIPASTNVANTKSFNEKLSLLTRFPLEYNSKLSLSLSGGMDSRVLLSMLMNSKYSNWDIHTFGPEDHPDRIVVNRISNDLNLKHTFIDLPIQSKDELINNLKKYINFSLVSNPASEIVQLNNYSYYFNQDTVIIDGGFGEIWRREFLNKLAFHGTRDLKQLNFNQIIKYLYLHKGKIFTDEINQLMYNGSINQLDQMLSNLPSYKKIGIGNWLDLFAIKTRLANLYSHEQARLDQYFLCYMPFVQRSLLMCMFSVPLKVRKNAKLYRDILHKNYKKLTRYPLAKGACIYPFQLTSLLSRVWSIMMKKMGKTYINNNSLKFLDQTSDFLLDTIHSREVKEYPYYDYKYIQSISNNFYNGDHKCINELDWFLSFEMLRQEIK